ncbi:MAG TPA: peptide chain release factor-like protein [Kofleriaceae bacterium]|nr:peptide chain release factor-like protein [Kofleriaceae bacterium]
MSAPARDALLALADAALLAQCQVDRMRGSGPGGQKRNKTESSVRVRHAATGLFALSGESRSQHENKARALRRLRERIAFDLREPVELEGYGTPPALAALLEQEQVRKSEKWLRSEEYLRAVGHLVDLYQAVGCSLPDAAQRLAVPQGRLDRIVRVDPRLGRKLGELKNAFRGRSPLD